MRVKPRLHSSLCMAMILIVALVLPNKAGVVRALPVELVVNGDFEAGNTGFSSLYAFWPGQIIGPGEYDVTSDPHLAHNDAASFGDHTSGSGLMMVLNGADRPGVVFWSQTVTVSPHEYYAFSAWLASWGAAWPAEAELRINGVVAGVAMAPGTVATWQQFTAIWNSGSATSATLELVDRTLAFGGNDFALDDVSFVHVMTASLDIKPGAFPNNLNPRSRGVIQVAILSAAGFDATRVDLATVRFGRTGSEAAPHRSTLTDVDRDGDRDLLLHFRTDATGIRCGDTSAVLRGSTTAMELFQAVDSIRTIGCR